MMQVLTKQKPTVSSTSTTGSMLPKSIRDLVPKDFGGIIARKGFAYQDHVAAKFCLEMLLGNDLLEVWCETYDDIVLIHIHDACETVEFVQVKQEDLDQLWSPAKLCARKDGEVGTSILEKSLARDCCGETVRFRLCTSLPPNAELGLLTLPLDHCDRHADREAFKDLAASFGKRIGTFSSANGHGAEFWISNALWESDTEKAIADHNKILLHRLLELNQFPAYCDTLDDLYETLLWRVKTAAEADWQLQKTQKTIKREELVGWLLAKANPLPNLKHEERLVKKLQQAGMDEVAVESAKGLRRQYLIELRQPRYLDPKSSTFCNDEVPAVLHRLRSELDSGRRQEEAVAFHHTCVERVLKIATEHQSKLDSEPPDGFLLGCMYEVTARCRHRFTPPAA